MTTQVQFSTFDFNSSAVRVITDPNQEHWFCGTDVCSILGYTNSRKALQDHCKEAGVTKRYISHSSGRKEAIFINEPNLYRLIIKSRKPEAEKFEAWVFEEVLPQIRKTGQYALQNTAPKRKRGRPAKNPFGYETYQREFVAHDLEILVQLWYYADKQLQLLQSLVPALEMLNSECADKIKRTWANKMNIDWAGDIIARICEGADVKRLAPLITLEKHQRTQQTLAAPRF